MTLQTLQDVFLGRSYYTFATVELKPTTEIALSPGQGNCMGAVPAKRSRVRALPEEQSLRRGHWGHRL